MGKQKTAATDEQGNREEQTWSCLLKNKLVLLLHQFKMYRDKFNRSKIKF